MSQCLNCFRYIYCFLLQFVCYVYNLLCFIAVLQMCLCFGLLSSFLVMNRHLSEYLIWLLDVFFAGASKQYGFVEFSKTLDEVKEIRHQLNRKTLQSGTVIACDLVSASVVDFEQLFSSCLCVKNLPADFTDDDLLLKKFSVIAKPLFCRVSQQDFFKFNDGSMLAMEN